MFFLRIALSTSDKFFKAKLAKHYTKINLFTMGRQTYFFAQWVETP